MCLLISIIWMVDAAHLYSFNLSATQSSVLCLPATYFPKHILLFLLSSKSPSLLNSACYLRTLETVQEAVLEQQSDSRQNDVMRHLETLVSCICILLFI